APRMDSADVVRSTAQLSESLRSRPYFLRSFLCENVRASPAGRWGVDRARGRRKTDAGRKRHKRIKPRMQNVIVMKTDGGSIVIVHHLAAGRTSIKTLRCRWHRFQAIG